jgi:peptidoglycan hydrolase-like protein with peptidoglycan-binding domain
MRPDRSFIGQPIRSLQTMLRVIAEDEPTHPSVIPDGIYGADTMNAVSFFQRKHGLPVTGVADQATWEAVVDRYRPALINVSDAQPLYLVLNPGQVIRKGERHPHLYVAQGMLTVLSQAYGSIPAPSQTGLLDDATADSIAWFQQLSALPMTGQLDKQTWKHLALQYPLAASLIILEGFDYGL